MVKKKEENVWNKGVFIGKELYKQTIYTPQDLAIRNGKKICKKNYENEPKNISRCKEGVKYGVKTIAKELKPI